MASFTLETSDAGQARQFQFQSPNVTIGRDRGADFTLDHPTVSRQHAVVNWDGRGYRLIVLSRGGLTAVDGQQVGGEVPLHDGVNLAFGQLQFTFRSADAPAHPGHRQPYAQPQYAAQAGAQQPVYSAPTFPAASTAGMHASESNPGLYMNSGEMPSIRATAEFDQWSPSGSFPVHGQQQQAQPGVAQQPMREPEPGPPAPAADGLVSWDQIAATADEVAEEKNSLLDFQRMQKEQEKADSGQKGVSPVMAIILILAIGGVALLFIYAPKKEGSSTTAQNRESDDVVIVWRKSDIDCIGTDDCREQALSAFEIGRQTLERQEADIINLYEGYKQLAKAKKLLEKASLDPPPEMAEADVLRIRAASEMKMFFLRTRADYYSKRDRNNYAKMAAILRKLQAYFPDERVNYHAWSQERVREMKDQNIYPASENY